VCKTSNKDGTGHLVRTLNIFKQNNNIIYKKLFLLGDLTGKYLVDDSKIEYHFCKDDLTAFKKIIIYKPDIVLFDTLHFSKNYFSKISELFLTCSLSPVFNCINKVDYIFHRTKNIPQEWKKRSFFPKVYNDKKYAVISNDLDKIKTNDYLQNLNEKKLSIAISMGGVDYNNYTLKLIEILSNMKQKFVIWVALSDAYGHSYENILKLSKKNKQEIIILKSNKSMWSYLKNCSLLICSGGITSYEAAFLGIPSINIMKKNWFFLLKEFAKKKICFQVEFLHNSTSNFKKIMTNIADNKIQLFSMHKKTRYLLDNKGAKRILDILVNI
jgi:spore coat polysaccharide biosynthesis predicted glycosyltransferase SpsG